MSDANEDYEAIAKMDADASVAVDPGAHFNDPLAITVRYHEVFFIVSEFDGPIEKDDVTNRIVGHDTYDAALRAGVASGVEGFEVRKVYLRDHDAHTKRFISAGERDYNRKRLEREQFGQRLESVAKREASPLYQAAVNYSAGAMDHLRKPLWGS